MTIRYSDSSEVVVVGITLPDGYVSPRAGDRQHRLADSGLPSSVTGSAATEPVDLTVVAVDAAGRWLSASLGDDGGIPVAPSPQRFKKPLPEWASAAEPLAQTFASR